jgi:sorting nexin-29
MEGICPIHKRGDPLECPNCRGITLLNTAYKVFANILYTRLKTYAEKIIGSYQCSFREGKSTIDQLQVLRQILETTREHKISTFHLFIDYKAAYDSIRRDKLFSVVVVFHHEIRPMWPVSVSIWTPSNRRLRGLPGRLLPRG